MKRREILQSLAALTVGAAGVTTGAEQQGSAKKPVSTAPLAEAGGVTPVNLFEFEEIARKRVTRMAYDYVAGGAGDEITLRRNRSAFDELLLKPRALRDVSELDTRCTLFGQPHEFPILLAPTAYHKLMHAEGEIATARGAAAAQATMVVSTFATTAIEDVGKSATGRLWFQLYVQPDRSFTRDLVQRAEAAGCRALVVTVDTPVLGSRNREERSQFALPTGMAAENLKALGAKSARDHRPTQKEIYSITLDPKLTWEGIDWLRSISKTPLILKGIMAPEDGKLAAEHGAAGIIVSNHGARNLDTSPATIEALPRVLDAVGGMIPVLVDGGIRRGTDVVKALAFGAKAVLIGRPYLWGLAAQGAGGVERVVKILRKELEAAMALCGKTSIAEIDTSVFWR